MPTMGKYSIENKGRGRRMGRTCGTVPAHCTWVAINISSGGYVISSVPLTPYLEVEYVEKCYYTHF